MSYTGYCEKQKRNYSVDFEKKPAKTLEDVSAYDLGRFLCDYAKATGCCRHPKQCSILKQNGFKF